MLSASQASPYYLLVGSQRSQRRIQLCMWRCPGSAYWFIWFLAKPWSSAKPELHWPLNIAEARPLIGSRPASCSNSVRIRQLLKSPPNYGTHPAGSLNLARETHKVRKTPAVMIRQTMQKPPPLGVVQTILPYSANSVPLNRPWLPSLWPHTLARHRQAGRRCAAC